MGVLIACNQCRKIGESGDGGPPVGWYNLRLARQLHPSMPHPLAAVMGMAPAFRMRSGVLCSLTCVRRFLGATIDESPIEPDALTEGPRGGDIPDAFKGLF